MLKTPATTFVRPPELKTIRQLVGEDGELLEEAACPLCGSENATLVFEGSDLLFGKPNAYRLVRCHVCTLRYVNPRPTLAALGAHYPDDYHCYRPIEDAPRVLQPLARLQASMQAAGRVKAIERVLGRIQPHAQILDVGCGRNGLLHHIQRKRGALGLGVEMKPEMVAYVREKLAMPIVEGTLLSSQLEAARFDLVVMLEYLEHEPDPLQMLSEARRVLKTGGHVVIEIPDPEGPPARIFGKRWVNLDVPRHLVFFDRRTIAQALSQTGFEVVSHRRFGIPFYVGLSVLLGLGARHIMRYWTAAVLAAYALGAPFLPAVPWLPEFSFIVARAAARPGEVSRQRPAVHVVGK